MKKNISLIFFFLFILNMLIIKSADDDTNDDWLHVNDKAEIVDKNGNPVWITGINWFGFNTGTGVFDGVWMRNFHDMLTEIADHGFNFLRVPMSTEILLQWKNGDPDPSPPKVNDYVNPELKDKTSFELWTLTLEWCKELGIKIMIDIHSAETDASGHTVNLWYTSKFSFEDWLTGLEWFAGHYKNDDTILAIDLKNEPHGKGDDIQKGNGAKWDSSTDKNNWKYAAEAAAAIVLGQNPNLLIMIEGNEVYPKEGYDWTCPSFDYVKNFAPYHAAWWGGNFRGVRDYPIDLGKYKSQLVYSPHDYGPLVYAQPWFYDGFTQESLLDDYWRDNWFFICEEKIAPLLIGEWGGFLDGGPNENWLTYLRDLMIENHIHHTFWCFNENSVDTGGMVSGGFANWDEEKYELVKPSLWQNKEGKFISLDHKIPVGKNGISLGDYYK